MFYIANGITRVVPARRGMTDLLTGESASLLRDGELTVTMDGEDITHRCTVDYERGTVTIHEVAGPVTADELRAAIAAARAKAVFGKNAAEVRYRVAMITKKKKTAQWKAERSRFGRY